ncbi:MAG: hypothetical protein ACK5OB_04590 [Pirellula sp.]
MLPNMEQREFQRKRIETYADMDCAVIDSMPDDWDAAVLARGRSAVEGGMESSRHELANPDLKEEWVLVTPNDFVIAHLRRLEMQFRESGARWKKLSLLITWAEILEQWRSRMDCEYGDWYPEI